MPSNEETRKQLAKELGVDVGRCENAQKLGNEPGAALPLTACQRIRFKTSSGHASGLRKFRRAEI